jgi:hypothetical protein
MSGGAGAAGLAHEFNAAVKRSAEDSCAAAGGGACEGQGADAAGPEAPSAGGQRGHPGAGRGLKNRRIRWMRSSITTQTRVVDAGGG